MRPGARSRDSSRKCRLEAAAARSDAGSSFDKTSCSAAASSCSGGQGGAAQAAWSVRGKAGQLGSRDSAGQGRAAREQGQRGRQGASARGGQVTALPGQATSWSGRRAGWRREPGRAANGWYDLQATGRRARSGQMCMGSRPSALPETGNGLPTSDPPGAPTLVGPGPGSGSGSPAPAGWAWKGLPPAGGAGGAAWPSRAAHGSRPAGCMGRWVGNGACAHTRRSGQGRASRHTVRGRTGAIQGGQASCTRPQGHLKASWLPSIFLRPDSEACNRSM